jgi:hypothetical protein
MGDRVERDAVAAKYPCAGRDSDDERRFLTEP